MREVEFPKVLTHLFLLFLRLSLYLASGTKFILHIQGVMVVEHDQARMPLLVRVKVAGVSGVIKRRHKLRDLLRDSVPLGLRKELVVLDFGASVGAESLPWVARKQALNQILSVVTNLDSRLLPPRPRYRCRQDMLKHPFWCIPRERRQPDQKLKEQDPDRPPINPKRVILPQQNLWRQILRSSHDILTLAGKPQHPPRLPGGTEGVCIGGDLEVLGHHTRE
mmetsp:Transcript_29760/g.74844  ORF Transcript_29760/g.74844 Transcript_29760/m.74844 type:complete len:222 (-) Transcript_29760:275-940(-)